MKNLKVGKKFIVSFGSILLLFLISVVAAGIGISKAKTSYHQFYTEEYGAVLRIDQIRLNLQGALKELMLGVVSTDPQDTAERMKNVDACMTNIQTNLQWIYDNYEGDVSLLREFESKRQANASVRKQVVEYASLATDEEIRRRLRLYSISIIPRWRNIPCFLNRLLQILKKERGGLSVFHADAEPSAWRIDCHCRCSLYFHLSDCPGFNEEYSGSGKND